MLVIRKKNIQIFIFFCVEYVAKFEMKLAIQNIPKKSSKTQYKDVTILRKK